MSDQPFLTVIVCAHNGATTFVPCLDALKRQRIPIDVLVVDDGSTDETSFVALSYGFTVVRHGQRRGIAASRNTGLAKATSTVVAFCDENCTPPDNWTEALLAAWEANPAMTVLGGAVEVSQPTSYVPNYLAFRNTLRPQAMNFARRPRFGARLARQFAEPRQQTTHVVPVFSVDERNMSVQREQVLQIGGFVDALETSAQDEIHFYDLVHERFGNTSVVIDPQLRVFQRIDSSLDEALKLGYAKGVEAGRQWRKTPRWPSVPAVGLLAIIALAVVAPFNLLLSIFVGLAIVATPWAIWFSRNIGSRELSSMTFPFVAFVNDWLEITGFIRGATSRQLGEEESSTRLSREPRTRERWLIVAPTALWLVVTVVLSVTLAVSHSPLAPLPGTVTMLLIPGASVMAALRTRPATTAGRVVLAVCLSMMAIMVVGGLASLIGPHLGLAHPLDVGPESVIWGVLAIAVLVIGMLKVSDPLRWILDDIQTPNPYGALVGGLLVLLSILGVAELNHSGDNLLSVFAICLDVLVLVAGVVGSWKRTSHWPLSALLYGASLALLLSTTLRGAHLDGWDVQQEFGVALRTVQHGVWVVPANHDPYASMLSLTVLPAILHSLVKLRLLAFFQLVVPAILALLPVAVFTSVRRVPRWITYGRVAPRPGLAFGVTVGLIVSSVAFSSQLGGITRQAMALTMTSALVMVLLDRTMLKRSAQIVIALLLMTISFTHYTTSYLLSAIFLCTWFVGMLWSKGWMGTPKAKRVKHRRDVKSRQVINSVLVCAAIAAAVGWNLGVTRNTALDAPSTAISKKGAGFSASTGSAYIPPTDLERVLVRELHVQDKWLIPAPDSRTVKLASAPVVKSPGVIPVLARVWNKLSYLSVESVWLLLGVALLYGLFRLGRRRGFEYSSDLVGLAVAGLLIGLLLRFSSTLAAFYNPERAAIFTAILLAAPITLFLDDMARLSREIRVLRSERVKRSTLVVGTAFLSVLIVGATGLTALFFGGIPPESLVAKGLNVQDNTDSTQEVATAVWLKNNVSAGQVVQSDLFGHLVLLSEPGAYNLLDEVVPPGVDRGAYVYLSAVDLSDRTSQAATANLSDISIYRTNLSFFNRTFYVVYSNGATRVYHR